MTRKEDGGAMTGLGYQTSGCQVNGSSPLRAADAEASVHGEQPAKAARARGTEERLRAIAAKLDRVAAAYVASVTTRASGSR
jgi:hypothetical protein